ncbi:hypothetical protein [Aquimarina agarivorans]|uniref:hypothetical protein n=1 Tax=Aquimarina agarivorans TaxID=980584 RepID=UPI0002EC613E|nr:hypothetical protein [Aquimarina agarivorans]
MKRSTTTLIIFFFTVNSFCQEASSKKRFGLGSSFFNLNESFDDLFLFNNSSPISMNYQISNKLRIENNTNITFINQKENSTRVRGSLRLSLDYLKKISENFIIYSGPQIGINTSKTKLINIHIGGEYFLHKNWSISNQVGLNFLFDSNSNNSIQTNSSIILRFYFLLKNHN